MTSSLFAAVILTAMETVSPAPKMHPIFQVLEHYTPSVVSDEPYQGHATPTDGGRINLMRKIQTK